MPSLNTQHASMAGECTTYGGRPRRMSRRISVAVRATRQYRTSCNSPTKAWCLDPNPASGRANDSGTMSTCWPLANSDSEDGRATNARWTHSPSGASYLNAVSTPSLVKPTLKGHSTPRPHSRFSVYCSEASVASTRRVFARFASFTRARVPFPAPPLRAAADASAVPGSSLLSCCVASSLLSAAIAATRALNRRSAADARRRTQNSAVHGALCDEASRRPWPSSRTVT